MSNLPAKKPKTHYTDEQREYLYELKTTHTSSKEICNKFNQRFYDPDGEDGKRAVLLKPNLAHAFYNSLTSKEGLARYLEKQIYHIQELPFASPSARIKKLGDIVSNEDTRTREVIECLRQIQSEVKYVDEMLSENQQEPLVVLKMEGLDDQDYMVDNENFTTTKQLYLKMTELYGDGVADELKKLIKEFKDHAGHLPWEEPPEIIEAEIIDGNV